LPASAASAAGAVGVLAAVVGRSFVPVQQTVGSAGIGAKSCLMPQAR